MTASEMTGQRPPDPLHGVTLKMILAALVERLGWEELGRQVDIRCFTHDPSIPSSLKFLRRKAWARDRVETLYRERVLSERGEIGTDRHE